MPSRMRRRLSSFQFALPRGERPSWLIGCAHNTWFQFALPRGERLRRPASACREFGFNSRSRVGSDCHHRMTGTVWLKDALRASLPERYRVINSILCAVYKIIRLFMLLTLSLTSRYFTGNWWLALDNQSIVEDIGCCLRAIMLNFIALFAAEHIKTQAVCCRLIGLQQFVFKACPLFGIDIAFKYGILHTHAVILTMCGDLSQSFCTACVSKGDIISNEYQH